MTSDQRIYLDHAASTPMRPEVVEAMANCMNEPDLMSNPFSNHGHGREAAVVLLSLRGYIAERFNCKKHEVIFNSGGSEGDTHALVGVALMHGKPIHIAISAVEHEAVMEAAKLLEKQGHRVTRLPVDGQGVVEMDAVESLIKVDRPQLVSVMAVNNETGVVQPVAAIAELCRENEVAYHCDAVRAVGHGFNGLMQDQNITLINCTAHKFGGPRGVGVLVARGIKLPQLICGGSQEGGSRAGTENLAGIAGLVRALELATNEDAAFVEEHKRDMEHELIERFPDCEIHGKRAPRGTHVTSVRFKPKSGYKLQAALDARGISVGTGSACHDDGQVSISPVLAAMGVDEMLARGTLRLSLGWNTKWVEITRVLDALEEIIHGDEDAALNCEI